MGGFWSLATCHWDWSWWKYDVQVMAFSAGSICCCVIEVVLANRIWAINKTQRVPGAWCGFLLSKTNPITFFYTLQNIIVFGCRLEIYGKVSTSQLKYRLTYKIRLFFLKKYLWNSLEKAIIETFWLKIYIILSRNTGLQGQNCLFYQSTDWWGASII